MQTFTGYLVDENKKQIEQPVEARDRTHAAELVQKAWPLACLWAIDDDPIAGYDAITGEVLFEDDEFTISYGDEGEMLLTRSADTTAEDAR